MISKAAPTILLILTILLITILLILKGSNPETLNQYQSFKLNRKIKGLTAPYVGPLHMVGCAVSDSTMSKMIHDNKPEYIGEILSNEIKLFGDEDHPEEVYFFKKISYYEVSKQNKDFYIMYAKATRNNEDYEVIIELEGSEEGNYDRTLCIIKDGKPETIILWIDNMRLFVEQSKSI